MIFALYFLEAGLVLIVAPWSTFWDRNVFAQFPFVSNEFFRGAVSGVGVITAAAGLAELAGAFRRRRQPEEHEQAR